MLKFQCGLLVIALLVSISGPSVAQTTADGSSAQLLKPEQLEALVAPIALYPDELLANVLAASTYPLEVVQADRWLKERKNLKGDALKAEVDKQSWDDSVKALAPTADVLTMMSDKLDWSKNLGDAVLAQQADVMDAIQRLRTKAYDNKKLATTKQQKVSVQTQESKQVVVIEQADPNTVYVPYYDPATVYGAWPYEAYPPYYFGYPSYIGAGVIAAGLAFGAGWAIRRWGNYWGGGANWGNRNLYVNHYNKINNIGNNWQHNPSHRQGVRYHNANVQQRFGNNNLRAGAADRMDFRGKSGQQVLNPGGNRPSTGDRAGNLGERGGGNRANVADRRAGNAGNRGTVSNRAANVGDRAAATNRTRGGGGGGGLNVSSGAAARAASARGRASFASAGGGGRSDIALKHDVVLLGRLANGLGYYRFSYVGSHEAYVGVIAQEVESVLPEAVTRGNDGFLRVYYEKLGLTFRSYNNWLARGARIPGEVTP